MKLKEIILIFATATASCIAATPDQLQNNILALQQQTAQLQQQLAALKKQLDQQKQVPNPIQRTAAKPTKKAKLRKESSRPLVISKQRSFHDTTLSIHSPDNVESNTGSMQALYPTALIADNHVVTYIAGTPVVTSPYTGDRPAFDGSDYIVNISSINRDLRLMQQRRRFYQAYQDIGYPAPEIPIMALSGKAEPVMAVNKPFIGNTQNDINLGSSELDIAAILNQSVEAFMSISYDETPPTVGPRVDNSNFSLNLGFVNIGDLNRTPFYFTAGQLYAPFGRYSSAMISSPLTMTLARVKTRPFIIGYKSQENSGPYAAAYGFISETTLNSSNVGGFNAGYAFVNEAISGDVGVGIIGSLTDSQGMQTTGSPPFTTFGGFASDTNGNEAVKKIPGLDIHGNISIDRYSFTAEWVGATRAYPLTNLSFNGEGAKPEASQFEAGVTFKAFDKPASLAVGCQFSKETLALNLPKRRISSVFSISLWKDTVESLEYRHDMDFNSTDFANGASAPGLSNTDTVGTGRSADTLIAQIGVYF